MQRKTVINNLLSLAKWAEKQTKTTDNDRNRQKAADTVVGIYDILDYVPGWQFDLEAWLDRPVYGRGAARKHLERIETTYYRPDGRKSLVALIQTTIEVLRGLRHVDDVPAYSLPNPRGGKHTLGIKENKIYAVR